MNRIVRRTTAPILGLLLAIMACGDDGPDPWHEAPDPGPAAVSALAYVVTECSESAVRGYSHKQSLVIRQQDGTLVTVAEVPPIAEQPFSLLCRLLGNSQAGSGSVVGGAFQRLGMSPDGSMVVFEVTDDFSIASRDQVPPDQEGIFVVRSDGSGLRRLAAASRNPSFRYDPATGAAETEVPFAFSPDGSRIAFTDIGPGGDAVQVFTMDLATGTPHQLTQLPPVPHVPDGRAPASFPAFLDAETITFHSYANPVIDGEELNREEQRRMFSVKTYDPTSLRVVPFFAEPGNASKIIDAFQITGPEPVARTLPVEGEPVNPEPGIFGNVILETFVLDSERVLQLTRFRRSDTAGSSISANRQRIFFYAAPLLETNPFENCQLFSIDRTGADLRQLTNFSVGETSKQGCGLVVSGEPGCAIWLGGALGQDVATGSVLFTSNCTPFGTTPNGGQIFAVRPDGTGLHQLTDTQGMVVGAHGSITVELAGPSAAAVRW
jgi:hypothetical protein